MLFFQKKKVLSKKRMVAKGWVLLNNEIVHSSMEVLPLLKGLVSQLCDFERKIPQD